MLRRLSSLIAATAVVAGAFAIAAPAAHASTEESQFVSLANHERTSRGLHGYTVASDLVALARKHSQEMAAKHSIYHNANLANDVSNWQAVGENVGMGGSASSIHQAFMNSAPHRANILDTDFTQVGMGTAYDDKGVLYVTQVFRKPMGSTSTAPAPKPTYAPKPKPTYHPVATAPTALRAASKPVAKPIVKAPAKKADPNAALRKRLAAARTVAASSSRPGALGQAVTYVSVMHTLV